MNSSLTAQSTSTLYGGKRVGEVSPAFIDTRKIRKRIAAYQKIEYPHGKGFQGEVVSRILYWCIHECA
jgi:hypothetical protein